MRVASFWQCGVRQASAGSSRTKTTTKSDRGRSRRAKRQTVELTRSTLAVSIPSSDHYSLPFAWEKARDEPLALSRRFVAELLRDNANYRRSLKPTSEGALRAPTPRATVVTCSDASVQVQAWDATPDNDDFTIRNIGNQITTSLGSIQYGVERLETPVLLILGHTDCDAIRDAVGSARVPEHVRAELKTLLGDGSEARHTSNAAIAKAAIANVHRQVQIALEKFGQRIVTDKLTVVGAIYDIHDELANGVSNISIVNVNGNADPRRLRAFVAAIQGTPASDETRANSPATVDSNSPPSEDKAAKQENPEDVNPIARDLRAALASVAEKPEKPEKKAVKPAPAPKHK